MATSYTSFFLAVILLFVGCYPSLAQPQDGAVMGPLEIAYVMEPFELPSYDEGSGWYATQDPNWDIALTSHSAEQVLFGNASLQVVYLYNQNNAASGAPDDDSNMGTFHFGWSQKELDQPQPPHNCHGATHFSFWYKVTMEPSSSSVTNLRFVLQEEYYHDTTLLEEEELSGEWQQVLIDMANDLQPLNSESTAANLDLTRLTGWEFQLDVAAEAEEAEGTILLDQLACLGGGELFGAAFYQTPATAPTTWDELVQEGIWEESFLNSEYSRNESVLDLTEEGVLQMDYTIEQVESWGGLVGVTYEAPGNAYYNLTGATHVGWGYHRRQPTSVPGRAHFRLLLAESSEACWNCSEFEQYYSFHYILDAADDDSGGSDGEDGRGTVLLPLEGDTSATLPLWLTGWSGTLGDEHFDIAYIKGFGIELNLNGQDGLGSTVSGAIDVFNMTAFNVLPERAESESDEEGPAEIALVLEPFESIDDTESWLLRDAGGDDDDGDVLNVTVTPPGTGLFGNSSLRVEYRFGAALDTTRKMEIGRVEFGPTNNCHRASHVSFWYRMFETESSAEAVQARLVLLDEDDGFFVELPEVADEDWHELRVNISEFRLNDEEGDAAGDGFFNLRSVRGWLVEFRGTNAIGTINMDQLACIGGEDMLGSQFSPPGKTWDGATRVAAWTEDFYNSEISDSECKVVIDDDILAFDYTIEQKESWGGYVALLTSAPGPSYYNLSNANFLRFGYRIREAASVPDRAHLRIILIDDSDGDDERYYSFNYVLDEDMAVGDIEVPLEGSPDPSSPFWMTGWSGGVGNRQFDKSYIKGFTFELSMNSQGEIGSTVSGAIDLFGMSTTRNPAESVDKNILDFVKIVEEPDITFSQSSKRFQRHEFLHNECFETCASDADCLYALANGRDCFTASMLEPYLDLQVANTASLRDHTTAFWVDDAAKRGDFCEICDCHGLDQTIDCRDKDLVMVPKTFTLPWEPRVLDLRNNPNLILLGSGALDALKDSLEVLWLPRGLHYISPGSLNGLPQLSVVHIEAEHLIQTSNVIVQHTQSFNDVCCSPGEHVSLSVPANGLTFCDMKVKRPGSDSTFFDFIQYQNAGSSVEIRPSSDFMAEAAESPAKCAEYCAISSECTFYSYDARWRNAEHVCYLISRRNVTEPDAHKICCEDEHYADEENTMPGWTSGMPPRTRHNLENARVLIGPQDLVADIVGGYEVEYEISLGSTPLRGAVWVEPRMASKTDLGVSFSPSRVVLYDANSTATVKVTIAVPEVNPDLGSLTLVVNNKITSCDVAFMDFADDDLANSQTVFIDVVTPKEETGSNLAVSIIVIFVIVSIIGLAIFVYFERKRKSHDSVWQVKKEELEFAEPPDIVGRGSFGLVLRATYRGTPVAVKRVIPPRQSNNKNKRSQSGQLSGSSHQRFGSGRKEEHPSTMALESFNKANSIMSTHSTQRGTGSGYLRNLSIMTGASGRELAEWKRRKNDFIKEMRYLSKLRHPCITTVMGAVIESKSEPMLVMELMDHGSLYDLLHNDTMVMEPDLCTSLMCDVSSGMRFLHAANPQVVHGDLKAANILVDKNFRAKVADFGLSSNKDQDRATGTPLWMAPELLRGEAYNSTASDVYSFGMILYEVYSRKDPYEGEPVLDVLRLIIDRTVNKRPPFPDQMPTSMRSMMSDCLAGQPQHRPTFDELDQRLSRADLNGSESSQSRHQTRPSSLASQANTTLFDIFPKHVAEALRDGKKVEAEHKDCVTIFFSDIVGFTSISSTLEPRKVALMLDRLYRQFDELSQKHDIYKVETIGDAYMAVSNLVKDQAADHVKRIAEFSVEAIAAANTVAIDLDNPERGFVQIRCGFHSGPVVADVVGSRNPRYCLFGDTVNTASRMESNGEKGRIHISSASAELLAMQLPSMPMNCRGEIQVKGKGMMETFWCNEEGSRREEACRGSVADAMPNIKKSFRFLRASANTKKPDKASLTSTSNGIDTSNHEVGVGIHRAETSLSQAEEGLAPPTSVDA